MTCRYLIKLLNLKLIALVSDGKSNKTEFSYIGFNNMHWNSRCYLNVSLSLSAGKIFLIHENKMYRVSLQTNDQDSN